MLYILVGLSTILLVYLLRKPARQFGFLDTPNERKVHDGAVPLTGGVAIALSFMAWAAGFQVDIYSPVCFIFSLLLMLVVGMVDDRHELSARCRLVFQIAVGLMMAIWGKVYVSDLGNIFGMGPIPLGILSVPFTVVGVVGVINAINMVDGVDGLAGGIAFIALLLFGYAATVSGMHVDRVLLFMFASAVSGFLFVNMRAPWRSKAMVFMGDAGSMVLGFILSWFAIRLSSDGHKAIEPITAVWILAIPLMDTVAIMMRRIMKGHSPFSADRDHLHHILLRAGFSVQATVAFILGISFLCGFIGLAGYYAGIPESLMCYLFIGVFLLYFWVMRHAWKVMRLIKKVSSRGRFGGEMESSEEV